MVPVQKVAMSIPVKYEGIHKCVPPHDLLAQINYGLQFGWNTIGDTLQEPIPAFLLCAAFSAEGRSLKHERFEE